VSSLRELQRAFANALRDPTAASPVRPAANLDVYRQHGRAQFHRVLELEYPVLRRRVGDAYFGQLADEYRRASPSRSGDLHWVGREFAGFLERTLRGTDYEWLADLARLEWACECASVAASSPMVQPDVLAALTPEQLASARFTLQPCVQLLASPFPVFSVWLANQGDPSPPTVQHWGAEQGMIHYRNDCIRVAALPIHAFRWMAALHEGLPLGQAVDHAGLDEAALVRELQRLFAAGLVTGVEVVNRQGLGTSS
jgi:uncharacterized protein